MKKNIKSKAKKVRLIATDVDGVLTDGSIIIRQSGEEVKTWNVKDGLGLYLAKRSGDGIKFAWITGRKSRQVKERAKDMGIDILVQDCMKKRDAMEKIIKKLKITPEEVIYIGDDLVDIPVFRYVGLSACPKDAPMEVKREATFTASCDGGKGILREIVELVLKSRGLWEKATRGYI